MSIFGLDLLKNSLTFDLALIFSFLRNYGTYISISNYYYFLSCKFFFKFCIFSLLFSTQLLLLSNIVDAIFYCTSFLDFLSICGEWHRDFSAFSNIWDLVLNNYSCYFFISRPSLYICFVNFLLWSNLSLSLLIFRESST